MATATLLPWTAKEDSDGRLPVYLVVRHEGERATMSLGMKVKEKQWNPNKEEVRKSHPDYADLNHYFAEVKREAHSAIAKRFGGNLSAKSVRDDVKVALGKATVGSCFLAFSEEKIEDYRKRGQLSTARNYQATIDKLRKFVEGRLHFEDVTPALLEDYRTWELSERGNAQGTVIRSLGVIRVMCNHALREGEMDKYPFRHITLPSTVKAKTHQWLRKKEIENIKSLELSGLSEVTRDIFLFQYYAWGMRLGDALFLEWSSVHEGRLRYRMEKTGRDMDLPLTPDAEAILRRYEEAERNPSTEHVFPLLLIYDLSKEGEHNRAKHSRTSTLNSHLKKIKRMSGIAERKTLTTHTARHSAAVAMYEAWKDLYRVKRYLGHANVTTTEGYLRSMEGVQLGDEGEWEGVL